MAATARSRAFPPSSSSVSSLSQERQRQRLLAKKKKKKGRSTDAGSSSVLLSSWPRHAALSAGIAAAADLLVQTVVILVEQQGWDEIDWRRNAVFMGFGGVYFGCLQWWLLAQKYQQWFPSLMEMLTKSKPLNSGSVGGIVVGCTKMMLLESVQFAIVHFPAFYAIKEFSKSGSWNPHDAVRGSLSEYAKSWKGDLVAMIQLWGPFHCIHACLRNWKRTVFRELAVFWWMAYLSYTRGSISSPTVQQTSTIVDKVV